MLDDGGQSSIAIDHSKNLIVFGASRVQAPYRIHCDFHFFGPKFNAAMMSRLRRTPIEI
jgi:hypothetical protein